MTSHFTQKQPSRPHSLVGRWIDADGTDRGDQDFYEKSMGLRERQEERDLKRLRDVLAGGSPHLAR